MAVSHTRRTGKRVIREHTRSWTFPYCTPCLRHARTWESASTYAIATVAIAAVLGVIAAFAGAGAAGLLIFVLSLPLALVLASRQRSKAEAGRGPRCACPGPAIAYLGWDGSVQGFDIVSPSFVARFARSNARSLINATADLRRLIDSQPDRLPPSHDIAAAPRLVAPPPIQPQRDAALEWISRIESFKGAVARRNALERALAELRDPAARRSVLMAASKIEVAAVLDKVDSLASVAAKRRHLEKAINALQADDIPDELQAEERAMLDAALRALPAS